MTRPLFSSGAAALFAVFAGLAPAQDVELRSVGPRDVKFRVAVPEAAAGPGLSALAREMTACIRYDLDFNGSFDVLSPAEFPQVFSGLPGDARELQLGPWRATRAETLCYVNLRESGGEFIAECRLFNVADGRQIIGKELRAKERSGVRRMAHLWSDEIVLALTGLPGIATSRICFSGASGREKDIYVCDYDGAGVVKVTDHRNISILPKFSPDGTQIAYLSYKDRYPFLYILTLRTGLSRALSKKVGLNVSPAWAPGGDNLALALSKDGNVEIYLATAQGDLVKRLTHDGAVDTQPTFSPDGNQIAFTSDRAGSSQIYVMNRDGSGVRRLSYQGGRATAPVWSPDGRYIAYVVERGGAGLEIYVMDADGSNARPVTDSRGSNESPSWAPDSRRLVFASTRSGASELWTVNIEDPTDQRRVPIANLRCQGPSWGPRE